MIEIKEMPDGNLMIMVSVTSFCDAMGYCELRVKHFLKGIRPPQTEITMDGIKFHEKEVEYEKEHFEFVPLSQDELADFNKDVEFAREAINTRFLTEIELGNKKVTMLIIGQADKVGRNQRLLVVEDTKFPANTEKYLEKFEPFDDQKLQTLLYLNSRFTETGSLKPEDWFDIPHEEKAWVVNIKDKNTGKSVRIFRGTQTEEAESFLKEKLNKFALVVLGVLEPEHHKSARKCRSCRLFSACEYRITK